MLATLEIATEKVIGFCKDRYRHQEFPGFLKHVARAYPEQELYLVMDNCAAYRRAEVRNQLTTSPHIKVYFTLTPESWLNLVEVWFSITERQAVRRGTFVSVRELIGKIREFINSWNNRKHPFIWTKTSDEILAKINRKRKLTSTPRHQQLEIKEIASLFLASKVRPHCDKSTLAQRDHRPEFFLTSEVRLHCDLLLVPGETLTCALFLTSKVRLHCDWEG